MRPRAGRPVILAASDDPGDMGRIERELLTRREADSRVVFEGSAVGGSGAIAVQQVRGYLGRVRPRTRV